MRSSDPSCDPIRRANRHRNTGPLQQSDEEGSECSDEDFEPKIKPKKQAKKLERTPRPSTRGLSLSATATATATTTAEKRTPKNVSTKPSWRGGGGADLKSVSPKRFSPKKGDEGSEKTPEPRKFRFADRTLKVTNGLAGPSRRRH